MPTPAPGELYQHRDGGLYRVDALTVPDSEQTAAVVCSSLDSLHDGRLYVERACTFEQTVLDAHGNARPWFARVQMPDPGAFEHQAYRCCSLPERLVDAVMARYCDPGRYYHAAWHIHDMFARAARAGVRLANAQCIAILFHDAVYVPGAPQGMNERMSALLLQQWAQLDGSGDVPDACRMIEDTADRVPSLPGSDRVIALDLASLADGPVNFDAYTEMVWLEDRHLFGAAGNAKAHFLRTRLERLTRLADTTDARLMQPGFRAAFDANLERMRRLADEPGISDAAVQCYR